MPRTLRAMVVLAVTGLLAAGSLAADPDAKAQAAFDRLINALRDNDRDAFLTGASDAMRTAITPEAMASLSRDLAPHLKAGVTPAYLGVLNQRGLTVRLWKLTFKDGRDDALVRVVTSGDRLDGFFIQ